MLESLLGIIALLSGIVNPAPLVGDSGTINQLNPWKVSGGYIQVSSTTASLKVPSLNCTSFTNGGALTADASGVIGCSNDDGGAGAATTTLFSDGNHWTGVQNFDGGFIARASSSVQSLCVNGDCRTAWPTGSGAGSVVNATGTPGQVAEFSGLNTLRSTTSINVASLNATSSASIASLTIGSLSGVLKAAAGLVSGGASTSDVPEGTNLYWTTARGTTSVSSLIAGTTTTALAEGNNLYYTVLRWANALAGTTTDALREGSNNLYFTNQRARDIVSGAKGSLTVGTSTAWNDGELVYVKGDGNLNSVATTSVSCSGSTSCTGFTVIGASPITISSTDTTASSTLLGDGNNWTGLNRFVNGIISAASSTFQSLNISGVSGVLKMSGNTVVGSASTSDVPEGTNSYWTSQRATTSVSSLIAGTTTTALAEGNNLYYTAQRVRDLIQSAGTLLVGTTTANTWSATQSFSDISLSNGTSTAFVATGQASTSQLTISNRLSFGGVSGTAWSAFCTAITGGAGLCDGTDDGGGGSSAVGGTGAVQYANGTSFAGSQRISIDPDNVNGPTFLLGFPATGDANFEGRDATTSDEGGVSIAFYSGDGNGTGGGGTIGAYGGYGGATGNGGDFELQGGIGGATSGNGGLVSISGGNSANEGNGGNIYLTPGAGAGSGEGGTITFYNTSGNPLIHFASTSVATTSFLGYGIDLKNGGCFAVKGVCIGGSVSGDGFIVNATGTPGQNAAFSEINTLTSTSTANFSSIDATSTSRASRFETLSIGNGTSSSFAISNALSGLLKTDGSGSVRVATAGTDYQAALGAGTKGQVLAYLGTGVPTWTATTTFSTGLTYSAGNVTCDTASGSVFGCLTSAFFTAFNNKISSTSLSASLPLSYNSGTGAFTIANAVSDGSTKGAASFTAADFNDSAGNISIDYTNGTAASAVNKGFLTSTDWSLFNSFNNKISSTSLSGAGVISYTSGTGVITTAPGTFAGSGTYTFPNDLVITGNATTTQFVATSQASTSAMTISRSLNFGGVNGTTWSAFCASITGGAGLCDGSDDGGGGATTTIYADNNHFTGVQYFDGGLIARASSTIQDLYMNSASTTSFISKTMRVGGLVSCDTIDTDASGNFSCGTDAGGAGGSPSGAAGSIQYTNGSSFVGRSMFNIDDTNFRMGIGTTSPFAFLSVTGTSSLDVFAVASSSADRMSIKVDALGDTYLGYGPSAVATVKAGMFGVGTTTPGSLFAVEGKSQLNGDVWIGSATNGMYWDNTNKRLSIGTTTMLHKLTVNGRILGQPMFECLVPLMTAAAVTADAIGSATIPPMLCGTHMGHDMHGTTDGRINSTDPLVFATGTPGLIDMDAAYTAPNNGTEGFTHKSGAYLGSATSSNGTGIAMEIWMRTPTVSTATTSAIVFAGFSRVVWASQTSLATTYAPTDGCLIAATSTANWRAYCISNSTMRGVDTGYATSTNPTKFFLAMDQTGFKVYANGTLIASISSSDLPSDNLRAVYGAGALATCSAVSGGVVSSSQCGISTAKGTGILQVGPIKVWGGELNR